MAWRPHPKNAVVNPSNPRAWGTCDRSGFIHNLENLREEFDWAGTQLINKRFLVGQRFIDVPQEQLRTIKIPPDPDPVFNARPESYSMEEGLMPLATESARTGDPGATIRGEDGHYIGVEKLRDPNYRGPDS